VSAQEAESDVEGEIEENGYAQVSSVVPAVKNKGAIRTRVHELEPKPCRAPVAT
jgi:hypothetical protein